MLKHNFFPGPRHSNLPDCIFWRRLSRSSFLWAILCTSKLCTDAPEGGRLPEPPELVFLYLLFWDAVPRPLKQKHVSKPLKIKCDFFSKKQSSFESKLNGATSLWRSWVGSGVQATNSLEHWASKLSLSCSWRLLSFSSNRSYLSRKSWESREKLS